MEDNELWMQEAVKKEGSLRSWCKTQGLTDKEGKVTSACIAVGKKSKNPTIRKRAVLAETFAKHRPKKRTDLDFFDFVDDFPTYFGRITRAGPFKYPDGIRHKKYDNLKELFSRIDHLPLYGSRIYGSHDEDKPTTELIGFMHNWVLNDNNKDIFSDIEYFKDIKELSDLKNPEDLDISLKFNVADPNSKVQDITELIHGAVSLNKLETNRCASVEGYGSCTTSTKTSDFRDTNDSRLGSESPGSDGNGYYIKRDDWFDFMNHDKDSDKTGQPIINQKNIAKVEDMGNNPISKEIEECIKSGKTEEECKMEQKRKERTDKEKVGNEPMKDDVKPIKKEDFEAFEALVKENEELKVKLEAYKDFEEEYVENLTVSQKQLKELEDYKEKLEKKEEKRKEKKLAALREDLAKPPYEACQDFLENHDYEFLKEHKKGLDGMKTIIEAKDTTEGKDFVPPSIADFGEKLEKTKERYKWMVMD